MTKRQNANMIVFPVILGLFIWLDPLRGAPWWLSILLLVATILLAELVLWRIFRPAPSSS